jgi:hypothetical protein
LLGHGLDLSKPVCRESISANGGVALESRAIWKFEP